MQTRLYDIDWSDDDKCQGCNKEEGTERHRISHCPCRNDVRSEIPVELRKWEQEQAHQRRNKSGKEGA